MAGTYKETLRNKQAELIRKAVDGSVLLGSLDAPTIDVATLLDAAGLKALPTTGKIPWSDLGWLTSDGAQFSRDVSTSDITSWGSISPTRTDVTSDSSTLTVACQETKLLTIGLATGMDMSTVTPDSTSGAIEVRKPSRPSAKSYRVLSVAVDEYDNDEIYICRYLPRAKVTGFAEQSFGGGDEAIMWGVTFTGEEDSALGFSESWIFGGPGFKKLQAKMALTPTTP